MTTLHLFRVVMKTKGGKPVYARQDGIGRPIMWTPNQERAEQWMPDGALEIVCSLRRRNQPARLERCDETFTD